MIRKIVIYPHADGSGWSWADVPPVEAVDDPMMRRSFATRALALAGAQRRAARYTDVQIVDAFPADYTAQDHRIVCKQSVPATTVEVRQVNVRGGIWYEVWHNGAVIGSADTESAAIAQARAAWRVALEETPQ